MQICRVDTNEDGFLTKTELEKWMMKKVDEHFEKALMDNEIVFQHLDDDSNGE